MIADGPERAGELEGSGAEVVPPPLRTDGQGHFGTDDVRAMRMNRRG